MSVEVRVVAQSKAAKAEPAEVELVDGPPARSGEEHRQEWADANGVDPAEMREIHHPGGWVDRFDGRGWVQLEGSD